jgi:hypothetical protein
MIINDSWEIVIYVSVTVACISLPDICLWEAVATIY